MKARVKVFESKTQTGAHKDRNTHMLPSFQPVLILEASPHRDREIYQCTLWGLNFCPPKEDESPSWECGEDI